MESENITESLPIIKINIRREVYPGLKVTYCLPGAPTKGVKNLSYGITIFYITLGEENKVIGKKKMGEGRSTPKSLDRTSHLSLTLFLDELV